MKPIQFPKLVFVLAIALLLLTVAGRQLSASGVFATLSRKANPSHVQTLARSPSTSSPEPVEGGIAQRIVGGQDAERSAWPWMAGLVSADEVSALDGQFCGAALVAPRWVMTAAHCLFDEDGRRLTAFEIDVIIGRHQLSSSQGERIAVKAVILHPSYNNDNETSEADMALLGLASASSQPPIALISSNTQATPGTIATALGWGQRGEEKAGTDVLHRVNVPIVDNETCNAPESNDGGVSNNMLCAGYAEGGVDTCYGDSGGPLVVPKQNGWLQVGVVSWGDGCALPNKYGVYTRVANFNAWVQNQISTEPSASSPTTPNPTTPNDESGNGNGNESGNESGNAGGNEDDGYYDDDGWYDDGEWYECEEGDEFCDLDWDDEYYIPAGS